MSKPRLKTFELGPISIKGFQIEGTCEIWVMNSMRRSSLVKLHIMKSSTHIPMVVTIPARVKGIPIRLTIFLGKDKVWGIRKVTPSNKNQCAKSIGYCLYTKSFPLASKTWPVRKKMSPPKKNALLIVIGFMFKFLWSVTVRDNQRELGGRFVGLTFFPGFLN